MFVFPSFLVILFVFLIIFFRAIIFVFCLIFISLVFIRLGDDFLNVRLLRNDVTAVISWSVAFLDRLQLNFIIQFLIIMRQLFMDIMKFS